MVDVSVRSKQTLKVKPGLSSFAEKLDLDGTKNGMLELLDFANRFVPRSKRRSTPLLLKATAGLRAVKPPLQKQSSTLSGPSFAKVNISLLAHG